MPSSPAISRRQATNVPTSTQRLSRHSIQWAGEIIPDSEEERQKGVVPLEVIEISSEEEDTVYEGPSSDDPFSIPNSWPANNLTKKNPSALNRGFPFSEGRSINATPRKNYRSRRIVESSSESEEEGDAGRKTERRVWVGPDIIELSDSSVERPTIAITPKRRQPTSPVQQPLHSGQEDASDDDAAILTLDEPKSARKPIRLSALAQGSVNLPISAIPGKRVLDILSEPKGSLTLNARPSAPIETPNLRGLPATPSTPKSGTTKPKHAPRTGKRAQAAAEQGRRERYAQVLFSELNHSVFKDGLPKETKLNWSKRLLTTAGRAKWHRSREGAQTTEIELAEKILDCDERIRNTLSHEMCHLACWIIDAEPKEGHGRYFKVWAARVMRKRPEIEITTRHDYEISHPYEWKCQKCAKIYGRFSKSIDPDKCVCGACKEGRSVPLFTTRVPKTLNTPRTSKMASTRPQDSPQSIPRPSTSARPDSVSSNDIERVVYSVHDSGSESDSDIAILTSTMGSVTIVASETS